MFTAAIRLEAGVTRNPVGSESAAGPNRRRLDENVDIATRKDRLGHTTDRVNLIYSHAGDRAQLAASEAIEKRFEAVQEEVQKRLSVTLTVTQQQGVSATC